MWSTYVNPEDGNMESIFTNIVDDLTIVKDEEEMFIGHHLG